MKFSWEYADLDKAWKELDRKQRALENWERSWNEVERNFNHPKRQTQIINIALDTSLTNIFNLELWYDFFRILSRIYADKVVDYIIGNYDRITGQGADRDFWPEAIIYDRKTDEDGTKHLTRVGQYPFPSTSGKATTNMGEGILELRERMKQVSMPDEITDGSDINIKVGDESMFGLNLQNYMGTWGGKTAQEFDNLFYAVMFGTGTKDKVGGNARLSGETKDPSNDGSWWLGPMAGQGVHFLGQLGVTVADHFLWAPRVVPGKSGELLPSTYIIMKELFLESVKEAAYERFKDAVKVTGAM